MKKRSVAVIGGGAAGFFGAITCAAKFPDYKVTLYEKNRQLLSKVRISGGGRCNVTHHCFDPALLVKNYPRGHQELRGPFTRFQPKDTVSWFESRGVRLKAEEDGRMFPITDSSETIIECLLAEARMLHIDIRTEMGVESMERHQEHFLLKFSNEDVEADAILIATGGTARTYALVQQLGHTIIPPVPSLFTFNMPESPLLDLAGIAVEEAEVSLPECNLSQRGPVLLTHWGLSGPAVLKLSAWGARKLHAMDYRATARIDWVPNQSKEEITAAKVRLGAKQIGSESPVPLPKQLWRALLKMGSLDPETRWASLSQKQLTAIEQLLKRFELKIEGKTTYKQEFVTCGGVALNEVNFKTMESKLVPGLYFAGEILDIDGVTGGFNFQNAWTTGWIAGSSITL